MSVQINVLCNNCNHEQQAEALGATVSDDGETLELYLVGSDGSFYNKCGSGDTEHTGWWFDRPKLTLIKGGLE